MNITNGTRIVFKFQDTLVEDTVRGEVFDQPVILAPYAPNTTLQAVTLTNHSWCFVKDIVKVLP